MRGSNPAVPSAVLAGLFPPGVAAAELREPVDGSLLFPEERQFVGKAAPKRVRDFASGRLCARRALLDLGFPDAPLLRSEDRCPVWPDGVVGSITHTQDFSGAVAARADRVRAIGLDAEVIGRVTGNILPAICTAPEAAWLDSLQEPERAQYAALVFSSKEAFYKCQYTLTRTFLDFPDVELDLDRCDLAGGHYAMRVIKEVELLQRERIPFAGRFVFDGRHVISGMVFERE